MKRAVFMLVLMLALGLCTSVLVAWAGALVDRSAWPDTLLTRSPTGTRTEMRGWLVEAGRDATLTWRTFAALDLHVEPPDLESPTELPAWSVGRDLPDQPGPFVPARERTRDVAWEVSAGWPMRCVRATRGAGPAEFALPGEFVRGGVAAMAFDWPIPTGYAAGYDQITVEPWPTGDMATVVPLHPMLGGLVVNTIVFALAWGVVLSPLVALRVLRRWRRWESNNCVQCGHPVAGLPDGAPCPECGRSLQQRTTIAELLTARAPMLGASLALVLVITASAGLLTHRWMAVDRLPPLHHAAAVGDVEGIERLVAAGAEVDGVHLPSGVHGGIENESMPLDWAAARGYEAAARRLLELGASFRGADPWDPPLHKAMRTRHEGIVELLLPFPKGGGSHWFTGMELPNTTPAIAEMVLDHHNQRMGSGHDAAFAATIAADVQLLDELLRRGADPFAIGDGNVLERAFKLDAKAWEDPYRYDLGLTRAVLARGYGLDAHALGRLLDRTRSTDAPPAAAAVRRVRDRLMRSSSQASAPRDDDEPIVPLEGIDRHGRGTLWFAVQHVEADLVRVLLEDGVDPRFLREGDTPAHMLTRRRDTALADPESYEAAHYRRLAGDIGRILDLLEAAEAEWRAREADSGG